MDRLTNEDEAIISEISMLAKVNKTVVKTVLESLFTYTMFKLLENDNLDRSNKSIVSTKIPFFGNLVFKKDKDGNIINSFFTASDFLKEVVEVDNDKDLLFDLCEKFLKISLNLTKNCGEEEFNDC